MSSVDVAVNPKTASAPLRTVVTRTTLLSAMLALHRLVRTDEMIRVRLQKVRFHAAKLKQILHFGLPSALQSCVIDLSNLMIQSYINSFGTLAMAGLGAFGKLEGFTFLPVGAFSMAVSTFISQNRGAGKKDRIRSGMFFGMFSAVLLVELVGLLLFVFAPALIRLFNDDPEVVAFVVQRAKICTLFYFLMGFSHMTSASLRGLGRPTVPTVVMFVCWCAVRVIVLLTIGRAYHNILLVCWIYPITWGLSAVTYVFYLWYLARKKVY